jgi:hypothetical protein
VVVQPLLANCTAGKSMLMSTAMIAITSYGSTRVKPSPAGVGHSVTDKSRVGDTGLHMATLHV